MKKKIPYSKLLSDFIAEQTRIVTGRWDYCYTGARNDALIQFYQKYSALLEDVD